MTEKLYAYVDESGQETEGRLFIVSVVIVGGEHNVILNQLEAIEARSRKRNMKWHRARHTYRQAYIDELVNLSRLAGSVFTATFRETRQYTEATAEAVARALRYKAQGPYRATILVDGLRKSERRDFTGKLRTLRIRPYKVRGVLKEENNAMIRLADAVCGLMRDTEEWPWAATAFERLQQRQIITEV